MRVFLLRVCAVLGVAIVSGCNTMHHLDDVGESYDKGEYFSGTASLVFFTPFTLLADVFTFGGTMDSQQSSQVWSAAASQYQQNQYASQYYDSQASQNYQQQLQVSAISEKQAAEELKKRQEEFKKKALEHKQAQGTGSVPVANGSHGAQSYRAANGCIVYDRSSNSLGDFIENNCGFRVWVEFVNERGLNAAGPIGPGRREAVSKAKGEVAWAACEYPGSPRASSGAKWSGQGSFSCK